MVRGALEDATDAHANMAFYMQLAMAMCNDAYLHQFNLYGCLQRQVLHTVF